MKLRVLFLYALLLFIGLFAVLLYVLQPHTNSHTINYNNSNSNGDHGADGGFKLRSLSKRTVEDIDRRDANHQNDANDIVDVPPSLAHNVTVGHDNEINSSNSINTISNGSNSSSSNSIIHGGSSTTNNAANGDSSTHDNITANITIDTNYINNTSYSISDSHISMYVNTSSSSSSSSNNSTNEVLFNHTVFKNAALLLQLKQRYHDVHVASLLKTTISPFTGDPVLAVSTALTAHPHPRPTASYINGNTLLDTVVAMIDKDGYSSYIEVTNSAATVSETISGLFPSVTSIVISQGSHTCTNADASSNVYVSHSVDRPVSLEGGYDCVQSFSDLEHVSGTLLPFELEQYLGVALCRCNVTILPATLPINSGYFYLWDGLPSIVEAAGRAVATSGCELRLEPNGIVNGRPTLLQRVLRVTNTSTTATALLPVDSLLSLKLTHKSRVKLLALAATSNASATAVVYGSTVIPDLQIPLHRSGSNQERTSVRAPSPVSKRSRTSYGYYSSRLNSTTSSSSTYSNYTSGRRLSSIGRQYIHSTDTNVIEETVWDYTGDIETEVIDDSLDDILLSISSIVANISANAFAATATAPYGLSEQIRCSVAALQIREKNSFVAWNPLLKGPLSALTAQLEASSLVYVIGTSVSLLTTAICREALKLQSNAVPVVVAIATDSLSASPHVLLTELVLSPASNSLLALVPGGVFSIDYLLPWLTFPEKPDLVFLDATLLHQLLVDCYYTSIASIATASTEDMDVCSSTAALFEEALIFILSIALKTTYMDMTLDSFIQRISQNQEFLKCGAYFSSRYLSNGIIAVLPDFEFVAFKSSSIYMVSRRDISSGSSSGSRISSSSRGVVGSGVSVYTLLHLGLIPHYKQTLLLPLYMELPVWLLTPDQADTVTPLTAYLSMSTLKTFMLRCLETGISSFNSDTYPSSDEKTRRLFRGQSRSSPLMSSAAVTLRGMIKEIKKDSHLVTEAAGTVMNDQMFSFVEHGSSTGDISIAMASTFPGSTFLSLEKDPLKVAQHVGTLKQLNITNNAVCEKAVDDATVWNHIYNCPELFRYQLLHRGLTSIFANSASVASKPGTWGASLGHLLSVALTTFVTAPSNQQVSYAMRLLTTPGLPHLYTGDASGESTFMKFSAHPDGSYVQFQRLWLLGQNALDAGNTTVHMQPVQLSIAQSPHRPARSVYLPLLRIDVIDMTRPVHHHFQSELDEVVTAMSLQDRRITHPNSARNRTSITQLRSGYHISNHRLVHVCITRDKDAYVIPYLRLHGITLISALRMGLEVSQRDRYFRRFLQLPLYEDMAPWNIILAGGGVDYIDYDTRDITFDEDIPKAYVIMSVLMNFKRTVEDFKKCGSKSPTAYGLPYVSDCVGSGSKMVSCHNLQFPVPCGDGTCHSNYISCLRSLTDSVAALNTTDSEVTSLVEAMSGSIKQFTHNGFSYIQDV